MNVYSLVKLSIFHLTLFLGLYVLILDVHEKVHRIFFLLVLSMGLWNLLASFILSADTKENLWFWFRLVATAGIFFVPMILHFTMTLTKAATNRWLIAP